jgi:tetratricopeptide (TPR) repeat protein
VPESVADTAPAIPRDWSHQHFERLRRQVEQLLHQGDLDAAQDGARHLLTRSLTAGENRYPEAPLDLAAAYFTYARALRSRGAPRQALEPLQAARRRLGAQDGDHLVAALEAELGECHLALGDADTAMGHYRAMIQTAMAQADPAGQLLGQLRLGAIQLAAGHGEPARETLERVLKSAGPDHPARADIQQLLATAHRRLGDFDTAEQLTQAALEQRIRRQDRSGEAMALAEMANLFDAMGRLEDAARLASQAAGIAMELSDGLLEGQARHNLGETLLKLGRLPEARLALEQALSHKLDQGFEAEPWKTWHLLARLDTLQGKPTAADARRQAVEGFLAHRRAGGLNPHPAAHLCQAVQTLVTAGDSDPRHLAQAGMAGLDPTQGLGLLLEKLRAVLTGRRDPALAEDPRLHYQYAAELCLLLERLEPDAALDQARNRSSD